MHQEVGLAKDLTAHLYIVKNLKENWGIENYMLSKSE